MKLTPEAEAWRQSMEDAMMFDPRIDGCWVGAKKNSPSRPPYTDVELADIRVLYDPNNRSAQSTEAVVIWTLLDMLEKERGWTP